MQSESKYLTSIFGLSALGIGGLGLLFQKYTTLTFSHLATTCQQLFSGFLASKYHSLGFFLLIILIVSGVICLAKLFLSLIKTKQKITQLLTQKVNYLPPKLSTLMQKYQLTSEKVKLIKLNKPLALTIGLFKPQIILSTNLVKALPVKQLEAVLLHELYHTQQHHALWLISSEILSASIFFLPIIKGLLSKFRNLCESKADQFVTQQQGSTRHLRFALAYVIPESRAVAYYPSFTSDDARLRINTLLNLQSKHQQLNLIPHLFISALVIILGFSLLIIPNQHHNYIVALESQGCVKNQCSTVCDNHLETQLFNFTPAYYSSAH